MTVNYIQTFDAFLKIINSRNEIIAYPVGNEGTMFLRFLEYHNMINNFCCVAAREVREDVVQSFAHSLPIIPINCLQHFRNSAVIIVSAPVAYHQSIYKELSDFGFEDILFISKVMNAQVENALKQLSNSAYTIIWSMNKIMDRITDLERKLDGQDQIRDVHKETFSRYRNCFLGKKIVIIGGGPSAKYYSPIKDAIHIGINFAWQRDDVIFDYLFTQDRWQNYLSGLKMEDGFDKIKDKIFVGKCIDSYPRPNYPENVSIKRNNVLRYYLDEAPLSHVIHQDICYHRII